MGTKLGLATVNMTALPEGIAWATLLGGINDFLTMPSGCTPVVRFYKKFPFTRDYMDTASQLVSLYRRGFQHLIAGNEPNNSDEIGHPPTMDDLWKARWWLGKVYQEARKACPQAILHIPATSPSLPLWKEWYQLCFDAKTEPVVPYDVVDLHAYWQNGHLGFGLQTLEDLASMTSKPIYVSECGAQPSRDTASGQEMLEFLKACEQDSQVLGVAFWVWDGGTEWFVSTLRSSPAWAKIWSEYAPATPSGYTFQFGNLALADKLGVTVVGQALSPESYVLDDKGQPIFSIQFTDKGAMLYNPASGESIFMPGTK